VNTMRMVAMPQLRVKKLTENAKVPTFAHEGDACFDLYCSEGTWISSSRATAVHTGLAFEIPEGWEMQIRPRSGLSSKFNITLPNSPATIDSGYRGEVKVLMTLISAHCSEYEVHEGDRIAQACLKKVYETTFEEVDELGDSERGEGGLGSSGK
jgi:dUTP pyrophosphatase